MGQDANTAAEYMVQLYGAMVQLRHERTTRPWVRIKRQKTNYGTFMDTIRGLTSVSVLLN